MNEAATGGISGSKLSPDEDELEVGVIMIIMMIDMMITMMTMMMAMVRMIKTTVMMAMALFQVRIDYKGQKFVGENGKEISGLLVSIFTHIISPSVRQYQLTQEKMQ